MLPSMPIISTLVHSPQPDSNMQEEEVPSSTTNSGSGSPDSSKPESPTDVNTRQSSSSPLPSPPRSESATSQIVLKSPRRSPCPDFSSIKKASPLKHVTPILRKYNVHRKAKSGKLIHLSKSKGERIPCVMIKHELSEGCVNSSPTAPIEEQEEDRDGHRTPSPVQDVEEPMEEEAVDCTGEIEFDPPSSPLENKDNEEELAALMRASTTIVHQKSRSHLTPPVKRSRHARELEATLAMLTPEDPETKDQRETHLAMAYLTKVREALAADGDEGEEQLQMFVEALSAAPETLAQEGGAALLYAQVTCALKNHAHLAEEFVTFLEPGQALECGQFMQHQQLCAMTDFITKLETFFTKQPHVVRMVVSCLTSLAEQPGVSEDDVMAAVLPLLRASPLLTDCFLRLLPSAAPPDCMMTDFEDLVCDEGEGEDDEPVETLHVPIDDSKDPYGGDTCVCTCHFDTHDDKFRTRADHCVSCGLKFIHGKIFLQTGKTLRPAKVTFLNEDIDCAIRRLTVFSNAGKNVTGRCRKRTGNSFSNDTTCVKDSPPKLEESDNEDSENYRAFSDTSSPRRSKQRKPKPKHHKIAPAEKCELVHLSPDPKNTRDDAAHLLSPNGSSSCDTLPADSEVPSPPEPDSTVPCDEESTELMMEEEEELEELELEEEVEEEEEEEDFDETLDESSQEAQSCEPATQESTISNTVSSPQDHAISDTLSVCEELVGSNTGFILGEHVISSPATQVRIISNTSVKQCVSSATQESTVSDTAQASEPVSTSDIKQERGVSPSEPSSSQSQSPPSSSMGSPDKDPCWTRDEDKAILQAFQQGGTAQRMLLTVRQLLPERTAEQIMSRFQILLKLLQQMSSAARESTRK